MNDDNKRNGDDKRDASLRLVADNDPDMIARERKGQEVEWKAIELKSASIDLTENILRVMAGAGKDYELSGQIATVLKRIVEYDDIGGYSTNSIGIALQSWETRDDREVAFERRWEARAFDGVIQAALRVVAGRLNRSYASNSILARAENELHMAMHRYREAQQQSNEAREREYQQREVDRQRRAKTERLYLLAPGHAELIDGGFFFDKPRDAVSLAFAEQRLRDLKFETQVTGNIVAYKRHDGDFTALADPRHEKRIEFAVYPSAHFEPGYRQRKRPKSFGPIVPRFKLQDAWKKDLVEKFDAMLADACEKAAKEFKIRRT
jgi:hypothetical protein